MPMDKGRAATPVVALLEPGGPEAKNDAAAAAVAETANMSIKYQDIAPYNMVWQELNIYF